MPFHFVQRDFKVKVGCSFSGHATFNIMTLRIMASNLRAFGTLLPSIKTLILFKQSIITFSITALCKTSLSITTLPLLMALSMWKCRKKTLYTITCSIMTLSIMTCSMLTLSIITLSIIKPSIMKLSITIFNVLIISIIAP
jgi:hypothetical protein